MRKQQVFLKYQEKGKRRRRRKKKQSTTIARGKFIKWQDLKSMKHRKITPFISFTGCNMLQITCHIKEPDKGTTTYSKKKKIN